MTPNKEEVVENFRVYIVRKEHQKQWRAKAQDGDDTAKLCVNAAANFMKAVPNEPCGCCCCDTLFSPSDVPHAFIVLIPNERDSAKIKAHAFGVCIECSKRDDEWLVDQGVHREGLAPTAARPGDKIH